jgi:hypothetical protein
LTEDHGATPFDIQRTKLREFYRSGSPDFFAVRESANGRVSRVPPVHTATRNCTRDEGGPFEIGNQVLISSHRKLLLPKAMVVSVAETAGQDPVRQG